MTKISLNKTKRMFSRNVPINILEITSPHDRTRNDPFRSATVSLVLDQDNKLRRKYTLTKFNIQSDAGIYRIATESVSYPDGHTSYRENIFNTLRVSRPSSRCWPHRRPDTTSSLKDTAIRAIHSNANIEALLEMILSVKIAPFTQEYNEKPSQIYPQEILQELEDSILACDRHFKSYRICLANIFKDIYFLLRSTYHTPLLYLISPNSPLAARFLEERKEIRTFDQLRYLLARHSISQKYLINGIWPLDHMVDHPLEEYIWVTTNLPTAKFEWLPHSSSRPGGNLFRTIITDAPRKVQILNIRELVRLMVKLINFYDVKPRKLSWGQTTNLQIGHTKFPLKLLVNNQELCKKLCSGGI